MPRLPKPRLIAAACLGATLALLTGCSDSPSPTISAWERAFSPSVVRPNPQPEPGLRSASDGLGRAVFPPSNTPVGGVPATTLTGVPNE